jgi:hypothetical protein
LLIIYEHRPEADIGKYAVADFDDHKAQALIAGRKFKSEQAGILSEDLSQTRHLVHRNIAVAAQVRIKVSGVAARQV